VPSNGGAYGNCGGGPTGSCSVRVMKTEKGGSERVLSESHEFAALASAAVTALARQATADTIDDAEARKMRTRANLCT